ncbi:hypothetical protein llap_365 [Limosa lapponica baueri]|uniref:Secreted protein n=1 Tax=Limosa lapponica baueri TaxID=1758121 RepID=A0A2I0UTH2_LIMLA|nr:hypothetical protein llap_365 [Limosa lapponica baueri]
MENSLLSVIRVLLKLLFLRGSLAISRIPAVTVWCSSKSDDASALNSSLNELSHKVPTPGHIACCFSSVLVYLIQPFVIQQPTGLSCLLTCHSSALPWDVEHQGMGPLKNNATDGRHAELMG